MNARPMFHRGFSMLIVLVLLAAAFAAVAAVSGLAVEQKYATASVGREPMARAIAETCADRAASLAELASPDGDFDDVLDPPGPRQFVPRSGATVQVPASATDTFHTWALLTKDDGYAGWCDNAGCGACLFRYDDNSDDGVTRSTGITSIDANGVSEGKVDTDVFTRDRDRSIMITAIGIYPVKDISDVNDAARTRVTIRRFVANEPAQASPAVWVGERFTTDNGKICGSGGVTADSMSLNNTPCICGAINGARPRTPSTCSASDCSPVSCDAQVAGSTEAAQENPVVTPPETATPPKWLDGHWFADPTQTNVGNLGTNTAWSIYVRVAAAPHKNAAIGGTYAAPGNSYPAQAVSNVDAFVYDFTETTPHALPVQCARNSDLTHATRATCDDDDRWDLDDLDCSDHAAALVDRPCIWTGSGASTQVMCAEGESPCWKPVQSFATVSDDFTPEGFKPIKNAPIPNVRDTSLRWTSLGGCTESGRCTGETLFTVHTNGMLRTRGDLNPRQMPQPLILIHETTSTGGVALVRNFGVNGSGRADLIRLSVITTGSFNVPEGAAFAGALCNSGPATPALLTNASSCTATGTSAFSADNGKCFAVRALGRCELQNNLGVMGHLRCNTISVNNTGCMVGGMSATAGSTGNVASSPCPSDAGISVLSSPNVIGDLTSTGSVCLRNSIALKGDIQSKGDVYLQGVRMDGQIIAEGNVDLKNDVRINVIEPLMFETNQLETVAWMESAW